MEEEGLGVRLNAFYESTKHKDRIQLKVILTGLEIFANGGAIWRTIRKIYLSHAAAVFGLVPRLISYYPRNAINPDTQLSKVLFHLYLCS